MNKKNVNVLKTENTVILRPFDKELYTYDDVEKWCVLYPAYMNNKRTRSQGRMLSSNICVENPTIAEITTIIRTLGLEAVAEPKKLYPRERAKYVRENCGRVRVKLRHGDGELVNERFPKKLELMKEIVVLIPKLKMRQSKNETNENQTNNPTGGKNTKNRRGKRR
ncbi:hypothetical protein SNEBB_011018 [Seison nebaliae]|nr:hypothetical protein SNEBB_011018 [Seison nebaliae]